MRSAEAVHYPPNPTKLGNASVGSLQCPHSLVCLQVYCHSFWWLKSGGMPCCQFSAWSIELFLRRHFFEILSTSMPCWIFLPIWVASVESPSTIRGLSFRLCVMVMPFSKVWSFVELFVAEPIFPSYNRIISPFLFLKAPPKSACLGLPLATPC